MDLVIFKNNILLKENENNTRVISFNDFKEIVLTKKIFNSFLKYENSTIKIYDFKYENYLVFIIILMRFITRNNLYYEDACGKKSKITSLLFFYKALNLIIDLIYKPFFIYGLKKKIKRLKSLKSSEKIILNTLRSPLYLNTNLWFGVIAGGSVGHIAGVINNFSKIFKSKIYFFSTDKIPTVSEEVLFNQLVPYTRFWDFIEMPTLSTNRSFSQQLNHIKPFQFSLIYQRYSLNNFTGVELALKHNLPFVLEYNGSEVWISRHWGKKLKYEKLSHEIELLNFQKANLIVVVSEPLKSQLIEMGISPTKILVNPNGVNPDIYDPNINSNDLKKQLNIENKIVIGFIGTFGPWHGAEVLAQAFCSLLNKFPYFKNSIHLLMIGDGIRMNEVINIIKHNGYEDFVTFTGIIPQIEGPKYLATCDILVSPHVPNIDGTPFFGSPTKLFEYMSMAKGIVASDLDQIGEILEHNKTALLVKPGDVLELASGIEKLILDKNLRDQLGINARNKIIDSYSWEIHTRKIFNRLAEII